MQTFSNTTTIKWKPNKWKRKYKWKTGRRVFGDGNTGSSLFPPETMYAARQSGAGGVPDRLVYGFLIRDMEGAWSGARYKWGGERAAWEKRLNLATAGQQTELEKVSGVAEGIYDLLPTVLWRLKPCEFAKRRKQICLLRYTTPMLPWKTDHRPVFIIEQQV